MSTIVCCKVSKAGNSLKTKPNTKVFSRQTRARKWTIVNSADGYGAQNEGQATVTKVAQPVAMQSFSESDRQVVQIADLKNNLLREIAGLDRGLAATGNQPEIIEGLVQELISVGGTPLSWKAGREDQSTMDLLQGVWRLAYTSAFTSGSLGGSRVGPPAASIPVILGSIYQVINNDKGELDNVVELFFKYRLPFSPQFTSPVLRASLKHSFQVQGENSVEIVFQNTVLQLIGEGAVFNQLPVLELPQFPQLPDFFQTLRKATFNVVYLDEDIRITKGDRGELRIYARSLASNLNSSLEMEQEDS
eukprot:TRINITY_DN78186_c0_g1_i7.p1 TRINITY_DN78186_c0_g1~~TRINITY_DN78186_c0_g1_i7.p1  ORF type:complete len:333 (-),score=30.33 TRINITY_DN78186_c0_g1_i7:321-1235(-)